MTATTTTDTVAGAYLEFRRFATPESPDLSLDPGTWRARVQTVLVATPGRMRAFSRGLADGGVRVAWRTYETINVAPPLTRHRGVGTSADVAFGLLITSTTPWLRALNTTPNSFEFNEYQGQHAVQPTPDVFAAMIAAAARAGWQVIKPIGVTVPRTTENLDKLYNVHNVAPWPVLQRAKKRYAKVGINI